MILWLGASLMACWSFSLFVRLVSELFARKRKRLIAQRSRRALWVGFGLIVVCAVVAAVFGYLAYTNAANYPETEQYAAPVYAISGSLVLFGLMMFVGASIGDRPRGRVRCPKCWYDMSAASGLQCPECGRTAKSIKQFSKAKRRKWAFVLGLMLIGTGAYGVSVSRRVVETDWLAAVPSWFLMAGWEWLPEDWILAENSAYYSTLEERFDEYWWHADEGGWIQGEWISDARIRRFGRRICRGLLDDQESRWDTRRLKLIASIGNLDAQLDGEWIGPPINANELLSACVEDSIAALTADNPTLVQLETLDVLSTSVFSFYHDSIHPYDLAKGWIVNRYKAAGLGIDEEFDSEWDLIESPIVKSELHQLLSPYRDRILNQAFIERLTFVDDSISTPAFMIAYDAGHLDDFQHLYLNPTSDPLQMSPLDKAISIGYYSDTLSDKGFSQLIESLGELLRSDVPSDQLHALNVLSICQRSTELNEQSENAPYNALIELAISLTIDKAGSPPEDTAWFPSYNNLALNLLAQHDVDGDRAFPLLAKQLLGNPDDAPYAYTGDDPFGDTTNIEAWLKHIAPLATSKDHVVRYWVITNLPVALGSPYDDELDQIAVRMLDDPDEEIADEARYKLEARFADILISP